MDTENLHIETPKTPLPERLKQWSRRNMQGDPVIWGIVIALSIFSILVVYSATGTLAYRYMEGNVEYYLFKHTLLLALSLAAMWVAHKIDYRYYSRISRMALLLSVPLLFITWQYGQNINSASRWLTIPIINQGFQPSDLAKLALISNLAAMLSKRQHNIGDIKESLIPILVWCGIICGLIAMTDVSTATMLFATCVLLMFIGRVPPKYLAMLMLVGVLAGAAAIKLGQRSDTVVARIERFMGGELDFQSEHSLISIATGGVFGKGPGNSTERNILPHPYSDFVFAIIVEEYGLVGGFVVLSLYLLLLYRGMQAASKSDRAFGGLLSAGLSFLLVIQALINMGVAVGLGPVTGLPLPLVSMGGTSLLFTGLALGIILSVSRGEVDEEIGSPKNVAVNG